jgi:F0F1-type ATP synthase membrane subunit b/b'
MSLKSLKLSQQFLSAIFGTAIIVLLASTGCDDNEVQTQYEETVEAQELLEETREQAAENIADAESDAVETVQSAREKAVDIVRDAKLDAAQEIEQAETNLQQELNQLSEGSVSDQETRGIAADEVDVDVDVDVDDAETVIITTEDGADDN